MQEALSVCSDRRTTRRLKANTRCPALVCLAQRRDTFSSGSDLSSVSDYTQKEEIFWQLRKENRWTVYRLWRPN